MQTTRCLNSVDSGFQFSSTEPSIYHFSNFDDFGKEFKIKLLYGNDLKLGMGMQMWIL